jgi:hypothetical protein
LANDRIFFCKTDQVNYFFKNCNKDKPFILITHNSDGFITDNPRYVNTLEPHHHADVRLIPDNLHKWFGCMVEYSSDKIVSIPIGVENDQHFGNKKDIINNLNKQYIEKREDKLVYVNFKISNNYNERISCYNSVKDNDFCTFSDKMFTEQQLNPPIESFPPIYKESYDFFAKEIKSHKFVLCPVGNGLESHRLWETLYLGSIPITRRNINYSFYEDKLPILMIDNWTEITKELLITKFDEITNKLKIGFYNLEMLNFPFWINLIEEERKKMFI